MRTLLVTTKLAIVAALPVELVNYFVVRYPADNDHLLEGWFAAIAAQWYVVHLPGIFFLNALESLRTQHSLGSLVLFLSGWIDTALLLAVLIWTALIVFRVFRLSASPLKTKD
jgi:hypothetical protein